MVRTQVGYAGGTTKDPTYHNLGEHSETIQIVYDPTQVSYEELLDVFWSSHNPAVQPWSRQYMSVVFYHSEAQRRLAEETKEHEAAEIGGKIWTEVIPAAEFYPAEAYHQKYRLQQVPELMQEFRAMYPDEDAFVASTAVARVNGYLGGNGSADRLREELSSLGLSPAGGEKLLEVVSAGDR